MGSLGDLEVTSRLSIPAEELKEEFSRSSGPGGQGVNKLETRVTLVFDFEASQVLTEDQREQIHARLASRITRSGLLRVSCEEARSQHDNRLLVRKRLVAVLQQAFATDPPRIATKRTKASQRRRMESKRRRGDLKKGRGGSWNTD